LRVLPQAMSAVSFAAGPAEAADAESPPFPAAAAATVARTAAAKAASKAFLITFLLPDC